MDGALTRLYDEDDDRRGIGRWPRWVRTIGVVLVIALVAPFVIALVTSVLDALG